MLKHGQKFKFLFPKHLSVYIQGCLECAKNLVLIPKTPNSLFTGVPKMGNFKLILAQKSTALRLWDGGTWELDSQHLE